MIDDGSRSSTDVINLIVLRIARWLWQILLEILLLEDPGVRLLLLFFFEVIESFEIELDFFTLLWNLEM